MKEADNDQEGQIGNGDEHANDEEAIEQACGRDASSSSSVTVDQGESQQKEGADQEGGSKPEPKKPTEKAGESEEQVEIEEISVPSNKEARKAEEEEKAHEPGTDVAEEGEEEVFDTRL
ncbi:chromo domain-containing protein cec-1-like [Pocillopora damicornis]|uniref:chromo domain-containing protein cec-1-like n=1 Tax=Pocillopora damicornis TaxID=46731 RepID=UPI000F550E00|nr:chromo domain-containing protein cec-1-like [Pocillopora damicornis]